MAGGSKSLSQRARDCEERARDCEERALNLGFTPYPSELRYWLSTTQRLAGLVRELSEQVEQLEEDAIRRELLR